MTEEEQFEKWFNEYFYSIHFSTSEEQEEVKEDMWTAWQASRLKTEDENYSPPWAKKCPTCRGDGVVVTAADLDDCPTCNSNGIVPIYYTPEQWIEWHLEHGWGEYEIPRDIPCWARLDGEYWDLLEYASVFKTEIAIIATEAGKPPEYWRPE